jgi:lysozyme
MEDLSKYNLNNKPGPWVVTSNSPLLISDIHEDEGTIDYQTKTHTFKNGKFISYNDTKGLPTIGYGHLILVTESFKEGITPNAADMLLSSDLIRTVKGAQAIATQYKMLLPELAQIVLTEMVFQLGTSGVSKFKNTLTLLAKGNYKGAATEMKDSAWYKQTPNRVEKHVSRLNSIG